MSKKDFEAIAEAIRSSCFWWIAPAIAWTQANEMAKELARTNPRFDEYRFLRACKPAGMDGDYPNLADGRRHMEAREFLTEDMRERGIYHRSTPNE